jgi:hypothetical protein
MGAVFLLTGVCLLSGLGAEAPASASCSLVYIDTRFENASRVFWEIDDEGAVHVHLIYDHERASINRANGHWHFRVEAPKGSDLMLVLHNFENIYNGRKGCPVSKKTMCHVSKDGSHWKLIPTELAQTESGAATLRIPLHMEADSLYLARAEPYDLEDLDRFLRSIRSHRDVLIETIGKTVEGRTLEMISIGDPGAPRSVLLRARAHPWEPGGNWVVEGLIRRLLEDDDLGTRCRKAYRVHLLPMANKDGVARGWTRFNLRGMDLNRKWDAPADPDLSPENAALERWIERAIRDGRRPDLAIDFHNDEYGGIHVSRPEMDIEDYLDNVKRLEQALREFTWFDEGSSGPGKRNPGTLGEGLLERYGIDAVILELNVDRAGSRNKAPTADDWRDFGAGLAPAFLLYFEER